MVGKSWKMVVAATLLVVSLVVLQRTHKDHIYEAKCVYAYWESDVKTNLAGDVVQPKTDLRTGSYVDYRRVAEESLSDFLSRADKPLFRDYLLSCTNSPYDVAAVSNAFDSVRFKVAGHPAAVVELFAKAESKELAIDVVKFTLQRYLAFVEEGDRNREEKAVAVLNNSIADKQRREEDASELVDRLEKAKIALRKHRQRITVVKLPYTKFGCTVVCDTNGVPRVVGAQR